MAANPPITLPAGFNCSPKQVLNPWEQTLYNLCEEYFYRNQRKSNRHPVLSQVRLNDAITLSQPIIKNVPVPATTIGTIHVPAFSMPIHAYAMSLDILITDGAGQPKLIFEADGKYHAMPTAAQLLQLNQKEAYQLVEDWLKQTTRDNYKDAIAEKAGIPVFRVTVDGLQTHIDVVHAEAGTEDFQLDLDYPTSAGGYVNYSAPQFAKHNRLLETADIELLLIRARWPFPPGWEFVTNYELR